MTTASEQTVLATPNAAPAKEKPRRSTPRIVAAACVGMTLVLAAGWAHRALLGRIEQGDVPPAQPLASLPMTLGEWSGEDLPLPPEVLRAEHFDDDYVNRVYVNKRTGAAVSLFVGYVGKPRAHIGHRPDVCFAAQGWRQLSSQPVSTEARSGREAPSVLYEFEKPGRLERNMLVWATYVINGEYVQDPNKLDRFHARSVFLLGQRPAYLARVQIATLSSDDHARDVATLREFAGELVEPVAALMPYWE